MRHIRWPSTLKAQNRYLARLRGAIKRKEYEKFIMLMNWTPLHELPRVLVAIIQSLEKR